MARAAVPARHSGCPPNLLEKLACMARRALAVRLARLVLVLTGRARSAVGVRSRPGAAILYSTATTVPCVAFTRRAYGALSTACYGAVCASGVPANTSDPQCKQHENSGGPSGSFHLDFRSKALSR